MGENAMKLEKMGRHTAHIVAKQKWNDVDIDVNVGERYEFEARGEWIDWYIPCHADGFTSKFLLAKLLERCRRVSEANWFALIGCLDRDLKRHVVIGSGSEHTFDHSGHLYAFANDVPGFYWNNKGAIDLDIKRVK